MRIILTIFVSMFTIVTYVANAQDKKSITIGSFLLTTEKDPFGDHDTVVAMAISGTDVVALRCIENTLSLAIASKDHPITVGEVYSVKFRADDKQIFDEVGHAINESIIDVSTNADAMIDQVNGAKIIAIRITGDNSSYTFTVPVRQADKVVPLVKKACGR